MGLPNVGGIRAAFLLTSTLGSSPRSAVTTGSTEVDLPYSGSPGPSMLYSRALAGTVRARVRHSREKSVVSFFMVDYLLRLMK